MIIQISGQAFRRSHFPPLDAIGIADPARGLFTRAIQEHRQQFTASPPSDIFKFFELRAVARLGVAEGGDDKGDSVPGGGGIGSATKVLPQFPESASA